MTRQLGDQVSLDLKDQPDRDSHQPPAGHDLRAWAAAIAATLPPLTESQVAAVARLARRLDIKEKLDPAA